MEQVSDSARKQTTKARPKLLPPKGQPDGSVYVLRASTGAEMPWAFYDGRWFLARRVRNYAQPGETPYQMAKAGWSFADLESTP